MKSVAVTFPGDANDPRVFGGAPHALLSAIRTFEPGAVGLKLQARSDLQLRRYAWNLKELVQRRGLGGYQYSRAYLGDLWRAEGRGDRDRIIVNLFQLYDDAFFDRSPSRKTFYVDQTLKQLFVGYPQKPEVSRFHQEQAIAAETRQFRACDLVICMCEWAARSVIEDYGVSSERVRVVKPGANIDAAQFAKFEAEMLGAPFGELLRVGDPMRFVFVGKEPRRKGLFRLLDALQRVPDYARRMRLTVIGPDHDQIPDSYRSLAGVDWRGRIDKRRDPGGFLKTVAAHDVGVLLSTAEATGLSLREFQMLGLALIAPNVGGSPEMIAKESADLVEPSAGPDEIAKVVDQLLNSPERVLAMKQTSWSQRHHMSWAESARQLLHNLDSIQD